MSLRSQTLLIVVAALSASAIVSEARVSRVARPRRVTQLSAALQSADDLTLSAPGDEPGGVPLLEVQKPRATCWPGVRSIRVMVGEVLAVGLLLLQVTLAPLQRSVRLALRCVLREVSGFASSSDPAVGVSPRGAYETGAPGERSRAGAGPRLSEEYCRAVLEEQVRVRTVELQRVVDELRVSEQRQAAILRSLPVAVFTATVPSQHDASWITDSVARFSGFPARRFVEEPNFWSSRVHPEDRERVVETYRSAQANDQLTLEYRWLAADDTYRWFLDNAVCAARDGEVAEVLGVVVDTTALKATEEALRSSERYYRGLFDGAHDAILVFEPDLEVVLDANARACELYRTPRSELIGRPLELIAKDPETARRRMRETLERGVLSGFETVHLRPNGSELVLEVNSSRVEHHGRPAVLTVCRDVSERKRLEGRLREAEKLEAVGRLAAGVAHDFNNLLTVVMSTAELALRRHKGPAGLTRELEVIRDAALRGRDLTRSLLGFSRCEVLERQPLALERVVEGMLPMLERVLPESIKLAFDPLPAGTTVNADQGQLELVLMNLCLNARDAMPGGGRLEVSVEEVSVGQDFVAGRPWARVGRYGRLRVRDSGSGIEEAVLARVFEPFYTTKESGVGSGLGLAMVFGIVKQHGGMIDIATRPGRGTTVDIYLPLSDDQVAVSASEEIQPALDELEHGDGERILLVEDQPELRPVVERVLDELGYRVTAVGDGLEAAAVLAAEPGPFDLVISDLVMPHLCGIGLYDRVAALGRPPRFLFTSGSDEGARTSQLPRGPRVGFIAKPYDLADLSRKIRALLAQNG